MSLAGGIFTLSILLLVTTRFACGDSEAEPTPAEKQSNEKPLCHNHPPEKGPPLPVLAEQFETTVEVTIEQKSYTMSMEIHYDYPNNDALVIITKSGKVSKLLYNFPSYEGYFIQDGTCQTEDLRTRKGFQLITVTETNGVGHVSHVDDLFSFGNKFNETYVLTNETVRGMPVDQWTSCVESEGIVYRLDYFFTKQNYSTPTGTSPVPVRAVLTSVSRNSQSTKDEHREHMYDFVMYKAGPCKNREGYQVPPGVVCQRTRAPKISQPTLADHFSMSVEGIQPEDSIVSFSDQFFDYSANLTRTDITPRKKSSQFGQYGYKPLKIIHDYSTGIEYVIDKNGENCSMRAIPKNSLDAEPLRSDSSYVHMRHGADIYRLSKDDLQYQGKRMVREIECDVWSVTRKDLFKGANTTIESCWAPKSKVGGLSEDGDIEGQALVQIRLHYKVLDQPTKPARQYINNIYKYSDTKPDLRAFDIRGCFPKPEQQMQIIFRIKGSMDYVVGQQPHHLQVAVRDAVSAAARIAPIRVNSFYFGASSDEFVVVWMTLYASPNITGDVDHPVPQVCLSDAYRNIERVINSNEGLTIKLVSKAGSKSFLVEKGSLKTDNKVEDPRCAYKLCTRRGGHSSGSMAALGIMMLIVGVVVGLVGAFFLWKRGTGIPYQVQD